MFLKRVRATLKGKNRVEKEARNKRAREIHRMQQESIYRSQLRNALDVIDLILENDREIDSVTIEVPKTELTMFTRVMYSPDMEDYSIVQTENATVFKIGRKLVSF